MVQNFDEFQRRDSRHRRCCTAKVRRKAGIVFVVFRTQNWMRLARSIILTDNDRRTINFILLGHNMWRYYLHHDKPAQLVPRCLSYEAAASNRSIGKPQVSVNYQGAVRGL